MSEPRQLLTPVAWAVITQYGYHKPGFNSMVYGIINDLSVQVLQQIAYHQRTGRG